MDRPGEELRGRRQGRELPHFPGDLEEQEPLPPPEQDDFEVKWARNIAVINRFVEDLEDVIMGDFLDRLGEVLADVGDYAPPTVAEDAVDGDIGCRRESEENGGAAAAEESSFTNAPRKPRSLPLPSADKEKEEPTAPKAGASGTAEPQTPKVALAPVPERETNVSIGREEAPSQLQPRGGRQQRAPRPAARRPGRGGRGGRSGRQQQVDDDWDLEAPQSNQQRYYETQSIKFSSGN